MSAHLPLTPSWLCGGCGDEWPCPSRRNELLAEYDRARVSLALYLGARLVEAAADLAHLPAGRLHARMIGWSRPATVRQASVRQAAVRQASAPQRAARQVPGRHRAPGGRR